MRSRLIIALIIVASIKLVLIADGCSGRKENAATKAERADNAAAGAKARPADSPLSAKDEEGFDLPEREEIRQTHKLTPGQRVFVSGFDGRVRVEAADTDMAEVLVVRSARNREELQYRQVRIEKDESLFIKVKHDDRKASSSPGSVPESRERVILRLPRDTRLGIDSINGDLTVSEVSGRLQIYRVVGAVRVLRAAGPIELADIDGGVDVTLAPLKGNAVRIRSINGDVDLRFEGEVNADVNAWSVNGNIAPDLPNVEKLPAEPSVGRLKARIGSGGTKIEVQRVNGNVTLSKAGKRDASAAK